MDDKKLPAECCYIFLFIWRKNKHYGLMELMNLGLGKKVRKIKETEL